VHVPCFELDVCACDSIRHLTYFVFKRHTAHFAIHSKASFIASKVKQTHIVGIKNLLRFEIQYSIYYK
jgi:hypothetical protein